MNDKPKQTTPAPGSPARVRSDLAELLKSVLPAKHYRVVSNVGTVDRLSKRLVQIEMSAFQPSANAHGARMVEVTIHVATHIDGVTAAAEDDADAAALEVFQTLETLRWVNPTRAEKTIYKDRYLGYDITTEVITKRS